MSNDIGKTNHDVCCESAETMAQVIDIMKCGWSREEIIKWLKMPASDNKGFSGGRKLKYEICKRSGTNKSIWTAVAWVDTWEWAKEIVDSLNRTIKGEFAVFVNGKMVGYRNGIWV